jgi:N-acetyl-alpha-D-muramate 1-phosphate uridylyltransferase
MIFAAGRGERMRPLTDTLPKPLLPVRGKALIDWHLEKFVAAGITEIVINVSYLADAIVRHVGDGSRFGAQVQFSKEDEPLETGGGLATAGHLLGNGSIAFASADIFSDIDYAAFLTFDAERTRQRARWWFVPARNGEPGREFSLSADGTVIAADRSAYTLANVGVMDSALLADMPVGEKFRLMPHYQRWVANGWAHGVVHHGLWANITTPEHIDHLNRTPLRTLA